MDALSGRRRQSRAERQAATRQALLDAAAAAFAERGFHGASLEEITARAGFTRGAFYSNFATKEELFLALLDDRFAQRSVDVASVLASSLPEAVFENLRRWSEERRDAWWLPLFVEFRAHALRDERVRAELARRHRLEREAYADAIRAQFAAVGLDPPAPPAQLAVIVQTLDHGLPLEHAIDPEGIPEGFLFDALALLFRSGAALSAASRRTHGR